jgi:hypothetical protein
VFGDFQDFLSKLVEELVNPAIVLLIGLAFLAFLWGLVEFIAGAENQEKREKGKKHIFWGLIGIFIMTAVWGFIRIIEGFIEFLKGG